jgi:tetratricopeptide (TPR) repeat protein
MSEPRRLESARPDDAHDRDSQVEALLVDGLDRYFSGQFDDAIHVWTRVLFLDRSHARARAYIDRARTALAERQRRADELLQTSDDLLAQGRTQAARDLLREAVATSGDDERAAALRLRLERVERAHAAARVGGGRRIVDVRPLRRRHRPHPGVVAAAVTVAVFIGWSTLGPGRPAAQAWLGLGGGGDALVASSDPAKLPVLSIAEAALVRARFLYARGRLGEALQALDRVNIDSPFRAAADALRTEVQQLLLADAPGVSRIVDSAVVNRQ